MTMNAIAIAISMAQPAIPTPGFFLPFADAGAGAVNTTRGAGAGSVTFTRATTAWAKLATGLWASVASGTARAHYLGADTTVGAYGGYLAEEARTNQCLQSRDLSNASWTKTTATALKDQVGVDGAANSASSLTATAGGGSCVQTITQAATLAALSFFIRRITGTGTITLKQGATTLDVTASINSATYTRVSLVATVLNPSIGIVLGTNGDAVAVDMGQFENGAFATSPIPTTTVAVTRNADVLTYPTSGNAGGIVGSSYAEITTADTAGTQGNPVVISTFTGSAEGVPLASADASGNIGMFDGTAWRTSATHPAAFPVAAVTKIATTWNGAAGKGYVSGAGSATAALDGNLSLGANLGIGNHASLSAGSASLNGTIKNVKIWTRALSDAQIAAL